MGNIQENCEGGGPREGPGSLGKVWIPAEIKKWRIHRPPKREKASDKHKLIDINVNKWVIFKEIASRGPWEPRRTQTCLIKGVWLSKGKIVTTCERNGVGLQILANNLEICLYQLICKGILEGCGRHARMSEDALRTWETKWRTARPAHEENFFLLGGNANSLGCNDDSLGGNANLLLIWSLYNDI